MRLDYCKQYYLSYIFHLFIQSLWVVKCSPCLLMMIRKYQNCSLSKTPWYEILFLLLKGLIIFLLLSYNLKHWETHSYVLNLKYRHLKSVVLKQIFKTFIKTLKRSQKIRKLTIYNSNNCLYLQKLWALYLNVLDFNV